MNKPVRLPHLVPPRSVSVELRQELAANPRRYTIAGEAGRGPRTASPLANIVRDTPHRPRGLCPLAARNEHLAAAPSSISFSSSSLEVDANAWLAGDRQQIPDRLPLLLARTSRRQDIVRALGYYSPGDREMLAGRVTGILLTFIEDPDVFMRGEVIRTLGNVVAVGSPPQVVPQLVEVLTGPLVVPLLRDPHPAMRLAVVEALGKLATLRFDAISTAAGSILTAREHRCLFQDSELGIRRCLLKLLTQLISSFHPVVTDRAVECILESESRLLLDDLDAPIRAAMIKALSVVVIFGRPEQRKLASEYLVNADWNLLLECREGPDGYLLKEALDSIELYGEQSWSARARRLLQAETRG